MIKLKSILNELDAPNASAHGAPMEEFTDIWNKIPGTVRNYIRAQAKESGTDDKWDVQYMEYNIQFKNSPLKEWLESNSVWSDGRHFVSKIVHSHDNRYFLLDGKEQYFEDALLGVIRTTKTDQSFSAVKLNTVYNLSGEEVHWSNVATEGKGHGSMLYDAVLDHAGVLFSDNTLFRGSLAMWRHHMAKKAFFGSVINSVFGRSDKYIIPLDAASIDTDWLRQRVERFVVLKDRSLLPKTVRRLEYNTRGLDPIHGLTFVDFRESFVLSKPYAINKDRSGTKTTKGYTVEDYLDNFSSLSDWLKYSSSHYDTDLQDFTDDRVEFHEDVQPNKVKLAIVTCRNVVLLLKNGADGISVQVLD